MSHLTPVPSDPDELRQWLAQQRGTHVELPPPPSTTQSLILEITLLDTEPSVWRRLVVPGDTTLDLVHDLVQTAMGWTDSHLHRFYTGMSVTDPHFVTEHDLEDGDEGMLEHEARLDQLLRSVGDAIRYEYDFGDSWDHEIRLHAVDALGDDARPRCIGGGGACPPEDVGGVGGYAEVAAWVRGGRRPDDLPPSFESPQDAAEWLPLDWHPDAFDVDEADLRLGALAASEQLLERLRPGALEAVGRLSAPSMATVAEWLATAALTSMSATDVEEFAAPYHHLLAAIGDGVELSAAGYLPAHLVQTLCPALGIHPILAGKANRESNVRSLLMFRKEAQRVGLLRVSGKMLQPTAAGLRLAGDPQALWRHVSERLPPGDGELDTEIGWFSLLALAGGVDGSELYDVVHELCVDSGWENEYGETIAYGTVNQLVWPTQVALLGARWNSLEPRPSWVPAAAASAIFDTGSG